MKKRNSIINIVIFMVIMVFLRQDFAYPQDTAALRPSLSYGASNTDKATNRFNKATIKYKTSSPSKEETYEIYSGDINIAELEQIKEIFCGYIKEEHELQQRGPHWERSIIQKILASLEISSKGSLDAGIEFLIEDFVSNALLYSQSWAPVYFKVTLLKTKDDNRKIMKIIVKQSSSSIKAIKRLRKNYIRFHQEDGVYYLMDTDKRLKTGAAERLGFGLARIGRFMEQHHGKLTYKINNNDSKKPIQTTCYVLLDEEQTFRSNLKVKFLHAINGKNISTQI